MLGKGCLPDLRLSGSQGSLQFTSTSGALLEYLYHLICANSRMDHDDMEHAGMDMGHGPMCNMNVRQLPNVFPFISC